MNISPVTDKLAIKLFGASSIVDDLFREGREL
jgi:hypothetical protein